MENLRFIMILFLWTILIFGASGQPSLQDRTRGSLIGKLQTQDHGVSGTVWAANEDIIYIENFHYDGKGPDAFFWMGTESKASPRGTLITYPTNSQKKLPAFNGENIILHLPPGLKIVDMNYLSVWCRMAAADFGHVLIPPNLNPPKKFVLSPFAELAHGVKSGNVVILDSKTFFIPNLYYDGAGPDAYFWVGKGNEPNLKGQKVPNEENSYDVLGGYKGKDIVIHLPDNLTVYDIDYLAMYCVTYTENFGHVLIPNGPKLWVPPSLNIHAENGPSSLDLPNCRQLNDKLQVQWQARKEDVLIRLTGEINDDEYMAFGLSPDEKGVHMINSDVVVVFFDKEDVSFHAVDYSITDRAQCNGQVGVCPDERVNGLNDASLISADRLNGITSVTYTRPYHNSEQMDIAISRSSKKVSVVAAIGPLNSRKEAAYHDKFVTRALTLLDFTSKNDYFCTSMVPEEETESSTKYKPWPVNELQSVDDRYSVTIGPVGGDRGYKAITGKNPWGIAFWINDFLIPELHVERNRTYHFKVETGDDTSNTARYHPLYITDSSEGGYTQKTPEEQKQETVYAGVAIVSGKPVPTAVGHYCGWQPKDVIDSWETSETFDDYRNTLTKRCVEGGTSGELIWTVKDDTPDLVYYQCYTHQNLGWKIHVHDPGFKLPLNKASSLLEFNLWIAFLSFIVVFR